MCNKLHLSINSVSPYGVRHGFVPCGKCEDCRNALRSSWVFRLRVELDKLCKQGWKIGFFTLTYDNDHLPHIPESLFISEYRQVECFDKNDIRVFFVKLKKWLLKEYGCKKVVDKHTKRVLQDTRLRYMLCSEYGEHTQRPHYHGIVCFPPQVSEIAMFDKIHEIWYQGFVFPRCFNGGFDSHGYEHKPFICESVKAAAVYAAKYCCKDLAWLEYTCKDEFHKKMTEFVRVEVDCFGHATEITDFCYVNDDEKDYSHPLVFRPVLPHECNKRIERKIADYKPFHYQSRSLGLCFLDGLTDEQKLEYLNHGFAFVGDDRMTGLPVYLRNKIIFNPRYVYEPDEKGKLRRLVRRDATEFFRSHYNEIFEEKVKQLAKRFDEFKSKEFWIGMGMRPKFFDEFHDNLIEFFTTDSISLARLYHAYYGVAREYCFDVPLSCQWYARYDSEHFIGIESWPLLDDMVFQLIRYTFGYLFHHFAVLDAQLNRKKRIDNRAIARIHDYWKSQT